MNSDSEYKSESHSFKIGREFPTIRISSEQVVRIDGLIKRIENILHG